MRMNNVIYLTVEGLSSSVFESQVYALYKKMQNSFVNFDLQIIQKIPAKVRLKNLFKMYCEKNIYIDYYVGNIHYVFLKNLLIKRIRKNEGKVIIHCRGPESAYIGYLIKKEIDICKVIYDVRGAMESELLFADKKKKSDEVKRINEKLFNVDLNYSFVSKKLIDYYKGLYGFVEDGPIICNSGYDESIFCLNDSIENIKNDKDVIKIVYVGGIQKYQNLDKIVSCFSQLKHFRLIIITSKKINVDVEFMNIKFYHSLSQSQVSKIICQCDYGIIYRDNYDFNAVATPTKITEYWGVGLKVIAINNAGSYTDFICKNNLFGMVIGEDEMKSIRKKIKKVDIGEKKIIASYAKDHFSMKNNVAKYLSLYKKIFNDCQFS